VVKTEGVLDNPLMNAILHQNAVKSKAVSNSITNGTVKKEETDTVKEENTTPQEAPLKELRRKPVLERLPSVPATVDVMSGNTKIGGIFAQYRFDKMQRREFDLRVGCSRYNGLMEIWGLEYLRKNPEDLRRHKPIYKEIPINNVRWIDETKMKPETKGGADPKANKEEDGEAKLKRVLKKQLTIILAQDNGDHVFDSDQRQKILQSAHKKVLKRINS